MCIRDRLSEPEGSRVMAAQHTHKLKDGLHLQGGAHRRSRPVSYTHLRAHETVLDLVCRLLLEKKTHTLSNNQSATRLMN